MDRTRIKWLERFLKSLLRAPLYRLGLMRRRYRDDAWFRYVHDHADGFERTYALLGDDESRRLMVEVLRHRVFGPEHVRLSNDTRRYRRLRRTVLRDYAVAKDTVRISETNKHQAHLFEVPGPRPWRLHATAAMFRVAILGEQYALERGAIRIGPRSNDVVLDCGGFWGDTALWIADRVGADGQVHSFEFVPASRDVFAQNLALNDELAERIRVTGRALWSRSGETLRFEPGHGAGTSLLEGAGAEQVRTITIDDYVAEQGLNRVDFIKMDIEGAELEALRGAEKTLRHHRPRLAISAYHKKSDLAALPAWIDDLGVGYRLFLKHATINDTETMLFADVPSATG